MAKGAVGFDVEFGELQSRKRFWILEVVVATGLPVSVMGSFWRSRSSIHMPLPRDSFMRELSC